MEVKKEIVLQRKILSIFQPWCSLEETRQRQQKEIKLNRKKVLTNGAWGAILVVR